MAIKSSIPLGLTRKEFVPCAFEDGQIATARIQARSPYQECPVVYSGAVERLPIRDGTADAVFLRVLFQSFARELRTTFEEELIGSWEHGTHEYGANTS